MSDVETIVTSGQTSEQPSPDNLYATAGIQVEPLTEWIGVDIEGVDTSQTIETVLTPFLSEHRTVQLGAE